MKFILYASSILVLTLVGVGFSNELLFKKAQVEEIEIEEPKSKGRRVASQFGPIQENESFDQEVKRPDSSEANSIHNTDTTVFEESGTPDSSESIASRNNEYNGGNGNFVQNYKSNPVNQNRHGRRPSSSTVPNPPKSLASAPVGMGSSLAGSSSIVFSNQFPTNSPEASNPMAPGSSSSSPNNFTCSASIGGGAFANPVQVGLTCTGTSEISYCLKEGSCCDPYSSGTIYTSPIVVGATSGNFCLSFVGKNSSSKVSTVVTQSYIINNTLPDIQITFSKLFYQTTQLPGSNYLRSNDFSKSGYNMGEINLKSHDPGPSGLNLDCPDILKTYSTFSSPSPSVIFNLLDMLGIGLGQEVKVPLEVSKLDYGDNYLTSYVVNNNFAAPLYACSTNKITLSDFDYFVPEISHGESGTNAGREFSASFVSYGFSEADANINRTPAGAVNEEDNGQELRLGSFGVFY